MVSKDEALKELARRELERRRSQQPAPEDKPWYVDAAQAADDMARLAASGMTFGFADKIAGYLGGEGTDAEREKTQQARGRAGTAGTVAEIGGAVATPMGLAGKGLTLAGAGGTAAMTGVKGLAARTGLMAAEGAGYGALTALGNDQDVASGAGMGAAGGALGNLAGEGLSALGSKVAGYFNKKPSIPTNEGLRQSAEAAYQQADAAGVIFTPQGVQRVATDIRTELANNGFHPGLQPRIKVVLDELDRLQQGNVTMKGMDVLRRIADSARASMDPSEKRLGGMIVSKIDDFMETAGAGDVLTGNQAQASSALKDARDYWRRMRKSEMVDEALTKAERRAASTGSGGNADNATRQNIRAILDNPKKSRGFTPDEKEAMEKVVRGTPGQNALRLAGKLSPQGNGLMAALGLGATVMNPAMAAAPAVGIVAKALSDKATPKNVQSLSEIIRAGSKSAATAPKNAAQLLAEQKREAIARALMAIAVKQGVAPGAQ